MSQHRKIHGRTVFALLALALLPSLATAQGNSVLKIESRLVQVDVVVKGASAESLSRDDFKLFDNGQEQEIAVFDRVTGATEAAKKVALPAGVAANLRDWQGAVPSSATVILIDRLNTPTDAQVFVNGQVLALFETLGGKEPLALYELRSDGLRIVHDFTDDPAQLAARAAQLTPEHSLALESSASIGGFESALGNVGLDPQIEELRTGNTGFGRRSADYFLNDRALKTSNALETITRRLAGLRGRRNLVWLSGRFPFSFNAWTRSDLTEEVEESTIRQMDDVAIRINEANVAIYPVDVRGPGAEGAEVAGISEEIARATGGRRFTTNAVGEAVRTALSDTTVVYTLGFYPSEISKDRGRRSLRVEVRTEGLRLLYRPNYATFGGPNQPISRDSVSELIASPLEATGVGLTARAAPAQGAAGQYELVALIDLADLTMTERNGRWEGAIIVGLVFRADDTGTAYVIPPVANRLVLTPEQYKTFQQTGFILQRFLNTEGRAGSVRVVVQDQATGAAGSVWVPVAAK